jgi:hypothetical protein
VSPRAPTRSLENGEAWREPDQGPLAQAGGRGPVAAVDGVGSRALTKVTSELHLDVRTVLADNR